MRTRTICRWGVLSISCLALFTVSAQTGRPQPPPVPMPPPLGGGRTAPVAPTFERPVLAGEVPVPVTATAPARPAPAPTVEDVIVQLEKVREQRAELDKQEKDLVAKLRERMKDQADRLNKLGILMPAPLAEAKDTADAITPLLKSKGGRDEDKR